MPSGRQSTLRPSGSPPCLSCRALPAISAPGQPPEVKLEPFSSTNFWTPTKHLGAGKISLRQDPGGDFMEFEAVGEEGMAATLNSLPFKVEAGREYLVTIEIRTENLTPTTAKMVGGVYLLYRDKADWPASWYPSKGSIAPANTPWNESHADHQNAHHRRQRPALYRLFRLRHLGGRASASDRPRQRPLLHSQRSGEFGRKRHQCCPRPFMSPIR